MASQDKTQDDRAGIEAVLRRYEASLNASDTNAAVSIYADDGIFMAQGRAPAIGRAAIRLAYEEIFSAIQLHVKFGIDEVEVLGDTAWVRTHSSGETDIRAAGIKVPEKNSELFIFQKKQGGEWRVARYLFATQNPPKG